MISYYKILIFFILGLVCSTVSALGDDEDDDETGGGFTQQDAEDYRKQHPDQSE